MWRQQPCDIMLREGRGRAQHQLDAANSFGDVRGDQCQLHIVPAVGVLENDAGARRAMLVYQRRIAPPQPDLVALQREIARGRERAVAAAEHRDLQMASPSEDCGSSSCRNMKCCTLPSAVRGRSSTNTISRGTLKRASCVSTCALKSSAPTEHPARRIT